MSLGKKAGLSYSERVMLDNVLGFSSIEVEEAMVPRADIVAIPEKSTLNECIALFRKAAHSRLPVYKETLDEIIGMAHVLLFGAGSLDALAHPQIAQITKSDAEYVEIFGRVLRPNQGDGRAQ